MSLSSIGGYLTGWSQPVKS